MGRPGRVRREAIGADARRHRRAGRVRARRRRGNRSAVRRAARGGCPAASDVDERFEALEQLAATDPLTGLANRRGCEKSIAGEISRAERERKPLSCIMLDIDRFKQVNDTMGHQAGDQVLREISAMLRQSVRAYDIVARWGGEEFLVILPGADLEAARASWLSASASAFRNCRRAL